jgi:diadenosine tetraphosphate (Ap4A) HIT family hydrolase
VLIVGWPKDWDARRRGERCSMCEEGRPDSIPHGKRFFAGASADAYLHRNAPTAGYTIVVWRGRHVAEPTELDESEWRAYWSDVLAVASVLETHYRPAKVNYEILGNGIPHLHVHLVLRHHDDPAPNRPLPVSAWEAGNAHPVPDDELEATAAALTALFP